MFPLQVECKLGDVTLKLCCFTLAGLDIRIMNITIMIISITTTIIITILILSLVAACGISNAAGSAAPSVHGVIHSNPRVQPMALATYLIRAYMKR